MSATISAVEWRIRRRLTKHAEQEHWPVTPLLLGRICKIAALAAQEARPADPPPPPEGGRKRARRAPVAVSEPGVGGAASGGLAGLQGAIEGFGGVE